MWAELGISASTGIIVLIALYFVIKWAVTNGIEEAYNNIIKQAKKAKDDDTEEYAEGYAIEN